MDVRNVINKENAIFAAKIAAGVVVTGTVLAGTGYLIHLAGVELLKHVNSETIMGVAGKTLGSWMDQGGERLFLVGKYTAYTVLVPTYIIGYESPKWIIEKGIPQGIELFGQYVVEPVMKNIVWLGEKTVHLWNEYCIPVLNQIGKIANDYLVQPLAEGIEWLAEKTVFLWTDYIIPTLNKIASLANDYLVQPLVKGVEWLADRVVDVLKIAKNYLLTPFLNGVKQVMNFVYQMVWPPLARAATWLENRVIDLMQVTNAYVLQPLIHTVNTIIGLAQSTLESITNVVAQIGLSLSSTVSAIYEEAKRDIVALLS